MIFQWSLSDCKSFQVSRTLLSILVDLRNVVVWMVSVRPLISNSSSPLIKRLWIVPSAPITIGITVIFMYHSFFSSLVKFRCLSFFPFSLFLTLLSARRLSFFYLIFTRSGFLAETRLSFVSQNLREFCSYHSPRPLFVMLPWASPLFGILSC